MTLTGGRPMSNEKDEEDDAVARLSEGEVDARPDGEVVVVPLSEGEVGARTDEEVVARLVANLNLRRWSITFGELLVIIAKCGFRQVRLPGLSGHWYRNEAGHCLIETGSMGDLAPPWLIREIVRLIEEASDEY